MAQYQYMKKGESPVLVDAAYKAKSDINGNVIASTYATAASLDTKVTANAVITGATKCKVTYDSKGLVTAGADLVEGDIPALPESKITDLEDDLAGKVAKNAAITAGTNCKITYDSKGLVTGGAALAAGDIPSLAMSKITAMTGYTKPTVAYTAISTSDSANTAIGKLEKRCDELAARIAALEGANLVRYE